MKVRWVPQASRDLRGVAEYLHREAPAVANRIVTEIYTRAMNLGEASYLGQSIEGTGVRRLVVLDTYIVYHRIAHDRVHILRIRHGAQKPLKFRAL